MRHLSFRPIIVSAAVLAAGAALLAPFATATATASTPACATSGLVVWLDTQGSGAAGSTYYHLQFTNLSGHACTLRGYPGVSAVSLTGHRLGSGASHNPAHSTSTVTLNNGGSAIAILQIADVSNYPSTQCHATTAAGLRVYPPSQTSAKLVPFPFRACSRSGPAYLHIESVQKA